MLFTEESLGTGGPLSLLESLPMIPRDEVRITVDAIPLMEMRMPKMFSSQSMKISANSLKSTMYL